MLMLGGPNDESDRNPLRRIEYIEVWLKALDVSND
jgi:hypothetical protein